MERARKPLNSPPKVTEHMSRTQAQAIVEAGFEGYIDNALETLESENPLLHESMRRVFYALGFNKADEGIFWYFVGIGYSLLQIPADADSTDPTSYTPPRLTEVDEPFVHLMSDEETASDYYKDLLDQLATRNSPFIERCLEEARIMRLDILYTDLLQIAMVSLHEMLSRAATTENV